jgi:hypothetical protein
MFRSTVILFVAFILALAGVLSAAATKAPETAVFQVPDLKDEALVKKLTQSLAGLPGILAAKADAEAGKFLVTFEPGKTDSEALTRALAQAAPEAKLEKVQPADPKAAKKDCGKCPSKDKCKDAEKDKGKEKK